MSAQDQSGYGRSDSPPGTGAAPGAAGSTQATAGQPDTARHHVPRQAPGYVEGTAGPARPRGAALAFTTAAAILMIVTGTAGFFEGLTAGLNGHFFAPRVNYPFNWTVHGWGWMHIVLGVVLVAAGVALLLLDKTWARIVGVAAAAFSALANFLFIPFYPLWAILLVALNAAIIWALLSPRSEARW